MPRRRKNTLKWISQLCILYVHMIRGQFAKCLRHWLYTPKAINIKTLAFPQHLYIQINRLPYFHPSKPYHFNTFLWIYFSTLISVSQNWSLFLRSPRIYYSDCLPALSPFLSLSRPTRIIFLYKGNHRKLLHVRAAAHFIFHLSEKPTREREREWAVMSSETVTTWWFITKYAKLLFLCLFFVEAFFHQILVTQCEE